LEVLQLMTSKILVSMQEPEEVQVSGLEVVQVVLVPRASL